MVMPTAPSQHELHVQQEAYHRRWLILAVLCFSLLVIVLDNSILNVAIPTIVRDLDASTSQIQWIVDSYTLVFAGLLLVAGALGDRFGRRGALQFGLIVFGLGSLAAWFVNSASTLIGVRAFMGIGGAFIMPATLSIITNVFPAHERGKAIGIWAGASGVGGSLGPLLGGLLLAHFSWQSVFLVNVPIVAIGVIAGLSIIPTSKDPSASKLDPLGAMLSIAGLAVLLWGLIEAPGKGWTDPAVLGAIGAGLALIGVFIAWELHTEHPMLDMRFFKNPRFSAASGSITFVFFAMFGSMFLIGQYLQFVLGYTPLQTGVRFVPFSLVMLLIAPNSARIVARLGTKITVAAGLTVVTIGLFLLATMTVDTPYLWIMLRMMCLAGGMALVMAPATESVMSALPLAKAGVGSAVNDTTRQVGGALGVAVIGSLLASGYTSSLRPWITGTRIPAPLQGLALDGVGTAGIVAEQLAKGPAFAQRLAAELVTKSHLAYVHGMRTGFIVAGAVSAVGILVALLFLPAHATPDAEARVVADLEDEYAEMGIDPKLAD
ncbi:MAG: MFS transporter [Actinomycetes bacterium]